MLAFILYVTSLTLDPWHSCYFMLCPYAV